MSLYDIAQLPVCLASCVACLNALRSGILKLCAVAIATQDVCSHHLLICIAANFLQCCSIVTFVVRFKLSHIVLDYLSNLSPLPLSSLSTTHRRLFAWVSKPLKASSCLALLAAARL